MHIDFSYLASIRLGVSLIRQFSLFKLETRAKVWTDHLDCTEQARWWLSMTEISRPTLHWPINSSLAALKRSFSFSFSFFVRLAWSEIYTRVARVPFQWIYVASIMPQIKYNCKLVSLFVLIPMAFDAGFVDGGLNILSAVSLLKLWLSLSTMLWFIMLLYIKISCCKAHPCSTAWLYLYREPQPSRLRYSESSNIIDDDRACMTSVYELDPIQCQGHRMRIDLRYTQGYVNDLAKPWFRKRFYGMAFALRIRIELVKAIN